MIPPRRAACPACGSVGTDNPNRLYTVAEVAADWKVSTETVYAYIRAKELPTVQLGNGDRNKLRVSARDLERFITSRTTSSGATSLSRVG